MRSALDPRIEAVRTGGEPGSGCEGAFLLSGAPTGQRLFCVVSDGRDWDALGLPGPAWEHVSVSLPKHHRCPTWSELEFVKRTFWREDEWAGQFHAPPAEHISFHPHVLHLWRPVSDLPLPPRECV
jgi:hypothetical protein